MTTDSPSSAKARPSAARRITRVAVILLILALLAWAASRVLYTNVPRARLAASDYYAASNALRAEIAAAAESRGGLKEALSAVKVPASLSTPNGTAAVAQAADGSITLRDETNRLTLNLVPSMQGGKLQWRCHGTPAEAMPVACREGS